ncbi:hypothetical protein ACHAPT_009786 [Fusarium lateritium]
MSQKSNNTTAPRGTTPRETPQSSASGAANTNTNSGDHPTGRRRRNQTLTRRRPDPSDLVIVGSSDVASDEEPVVVRRPHIPDEGFVKVLPEDAVDDGECEDFEEVGDKKAADDADEVRVKDAKTLKDVDKMVKKGDSGAVVYSLDDADTREHPGDS